MKTLTTLALLALLELTVTAPARADQSTTVAAADLQPPAGDSAAPEQTPPADNPAEPKADGDTAQPAAQATPEADTPAPVTGEPADQK
jgi:hypothetical protein